MCLLFVSYVILVNNVLFFIPYFVGPSVETCSMGNLVEKVSDIPSRSFSVVCVCEKPTSMSSRFWALNNIHCGLK